MSVSIIKAILEADATLLATASGGIYDLDETKRMGLNRTNVAAAFTDQGVIKPCLLVKGRKRAPDGGPNDPISQEATTRQVVELWFYQSDGYGSIETMKNRAYALLHEKQANGVFAIRWVGDIGQARDEDLEANVDRSDYEVRALRTV
jgi:hypothetical protein